MKGKQPKKWFALAINAEPSATDAIEHALNELNALGTEIDHLRRKADDDVTVIGYFDGPPADEILHDELHNALQIYDLDENAVRFIERHELEDQDWLREWKKHWKPTEVGDFVITPPWEDVTQDNKIVIRIEPNMAFGTGTHETTQLCLKAIEENYVRGQSFLDVGTGTGILAIAAAKLNPDNTAVVLACDTDCDSVRIAKENAELNCVANRISFFPGSISEKTAAHDFVCANLTADAILPLLPLLLRKVIKTLVLSGILAEQREMIERPLRDLGCFNWTVQQAGEWISILIKK